MGGALVYNCPAILEGKEYGTEADIWAIGCVIYKIYEKKKSFDGHTKEECLE